MTVAISVLLGLLAFARLNSRVIRRNFIRIVLGVLVYYRATFCCCAGWFWRCPAEHRQGYLCVNRRHK